MGKIDKKKLEQFLEEHREEMVQDICDMIRIPSVVTEPVGEFPYGEQAAAAVDQFRKIAQRLGFETKNVDYRAVYASSGGKKRGLDLLTHLDVVPAGDEWTVTDGYTPLVKDGKIYGRGAMDDKGPLIMALYALYAVRCLEISLDKEVRIVAGSNEENGGREDLRYYLEKEGEAEITLCPDGDYPVINVEKGKLRGKTTAKFSDTGALPKIVSVSGGSKRYIIPGETQAVIQGFEAGELQNYIREAEKETGIRFTVTEEKDKKCTLLATGEESHMGAPEAGNNALTGMLHLLCMLPFAPCEGFERLKGLNRVFPHGDYLGKASGIQRKTEDSGELFAVFNIFHYSPEEFTGSFDCKLPRGCTEENTKNILIAALEKQGITVKDSEFAEALYMPMDGKLMQTILKFYTEYTGKESYGITINGNTYVDILKNQRATFGCMMPGTDYHIHFGDEYALVEELLTSAKIYAELIAEFCS